MKAITCLLIEDEKLTRDELRYLLEPYDYIEVIGEASSGTEGYELIKSLRPDLIFFGYQHARLERYRTCRKTELFGLSTTARLYHGTSGTCSQSL